MNTDPPKKNINYKYPLYVEWWKVEEGKRKKEKKDGLRP